ncbi:hypothetical protein GGR56DRAFT_681984 [Xylariaceae sp. FL0804]|nr:hypothetical protein GGR56DRAFT_681984 [Xylariaceae sp. FL0804]
MPPRLQPWPIWPGGSIFRRRTLPKRQPVCFFCSLSSNFRLEPARGAKKRALPTRRPLSTDTPSASNNTRRELEDTLVQLQKYAANYVNLARVRLALSSLRKPAGTEPIRVAILGLSNGSESSKTAKEVLRLLLADPLKDAESWEQEVDGHDLARPMLIRVGADSGDVPLSRGSLLHEVRVDSATLNGHDLEILLTEANSFLSAQELSALGGVENAVLVPTVGFSSSKDRYSSIPTPVHKALVVADGLMGAASVGAISNHDSANVVAAAVNFSDYKPVDAPSLPFTLIDVGTAKDGLDLIRKDLGNAMKYERQWFQSNVPKLVEWLKADVVTSPDGHTKPPVKALIASLLRRTSAAVQSQEAQLRSQEARNLVASLTSTSAPTSLEVLGKDLESWAESAHTELQQQLDLAFSSQRWRKLGWWKLFWRVDDVSMLTNDMLTQSFLPKAERSAIFLAGRMKEAGVPLTSLANAPVEVTVDGAPTGDRTVDSPAPDATSRSRPTMESDWPANIPATRHHLQQSSVPELQALAQRLVAQALGTSGLTTALGALVYVGTLTTTLYEAGAVAALGAAWSLRRLQRHWEAARGAWQGEVREEGRRAVRGVERAVGEALLDQPSEERRDIDRVRALIARAEQLLRELK